MVGFSLSKSSTEAVNAKKQAQAQAFKNWWITASIDDKKQVYEYAYKYLSIGYHKQELQKALTTNDFSGVEIAAFTNDINDYLVAGYSKYFTNTKKPPLERSQKPIEPQKVSDPTYPTTPPQNEPNELTNTLTTRQLFERLSKDEQEAIKQYTNWYIDNNGITDPTAVNIIKRQAVIERWGVD